MQLFYFFLYLIFFFFFFFYDRLDSLTIKVPETKTAEFANSVVLDEVAHNEPPHLDLPCLPSSL